MLSEQRPALDELLTKMRSGRMNRRSFLERVLVLGLTSGAATSLLESCGGTNSNTTYLVWQSEFDITPTYHEIVDMFNKTNPDNIHVLVQSIPGGTDDLTIVERNMLKAQNTSIDIFSIDITTVASFASQQWIMPISEKQWPLQSRANYLAAPIRGCTFDGQLWAAPYRTDVGLLYYLKDYVTTPPKTWEDMQAISLQQVPKASSSKLKYGYVWQGSQYEGLVCNFDEVLHGYGGSIIDPLDPSKVTVNSPEAVEALTMMTKWVGTISPPDTSTYTEEVSRNTWEAKEAIFMRNWPYVYGDILKRALNLKFAIHPLLYGGQNTIGHSSIGGWQLAINKYINADRQAAAWKFIQFMLGEKAQTHGAQQASWLVTLRSIYKDPTILKKVPLFQDIDPILQAAVPRPVTPRYDEISLAIRQRVRQALSSTSSVTQALKDLESDIKPLLVP